MGLLAWTFSVNGNEGRLSSDSRAWAVARLDKARMADDIRRCRAAGAEFLIAFPHWDVEFMNEPSADTRRLAAWLLSTGVDAVLGSHPHVVQPAEFVTVQRDGKPYTGLVVYSMGNFISNMSPSPEDYGLFVRIALARLPDGSVKLSDARLLPLFCIKHNADGRLLHEVLPALADVSSVPATGPLTRTRPRQTRSLPRLGPRGLRQRRTHAGRPGHGVVAARIARERNGVRLLFFRTKEK